jgi:hypothetical protein
VSRLDCATRARVAAIILSSTAAIENLLIIRDQQVYKVSRRHSITHGGIALGAPILATSAEKVGVLP